MAVGEKEEIDELTRTHPKFRAFAIEIDACMQLFERSREWSDYVSALSKLIKVFQRPDYNDVNKVGSLNIIPEKGLLARRLNQCTNPILPSGVHRKALDAYRVIIARIGSKQLASDLALWSSGLFSLFPHANTECKHLELKLFSDFYLSLGPQLTPCMTGLITSLLPGIEDEASEFFVQTNKVLDEIRMATSARQFFLCLWWILSNCPSVRLPALRLIDSQLSLQGSLQTPSIRASALPDHGTLVLGSLRAALEDSLILVQRAVLDLLVSHFPMNLGVWDEEQWKLLIRSALRLYGRRDMSLTRRLHTWLRVSCDEDADPVKATALERIVSSLSSLLRDEYRDTVGATLPFRVLRVLTERAELSESLPRLLAVPLLCSLLDARPAENAKVAPNQGSSALKDFGKERFQFGCSLLREFDPGLLWGALSDEVEATWDDDESLSDNLNLVSFFLGEFGSDPGSFAADPVGLSVDAFSLVAGRMCDDVQILPVMWANGRCAEAHRVLARVKPMLSALLLMVENVESIPNILGQNAEETFDKWGREEAVANGQTPLNLLSRLLAVLVRILRQPPSEALVPFKKVWDEVLESLNASLLLLRTILSLMRPEDALKLALATDDAGEEGREARRSEGEGREAGRSEGERREAGRSEGERWEAGRSEGDEEESDSEVAGEEARKNAEARDTAQGPEADVKAEGDADSSGGARLRTADSDWLTTLFECCEVESALVFCVGIRALLDARDTFGAEKICMRWPVCGKSDWSGLAATLWNAMDDEVAAPAAAELFFRIQLIEERSCRGVVSTALLGQPSLISYGVVTQEDLNARQMGYFRFERFWSSSHKYFGSDERDDKVLSHGLMLTLDGLNDRDHTVQLFARNFIMNALSQVDRVLDPVLRMLLQAGDSTRSQLDIARVTHVMGRIGAIVERAYERLRACSDRPVTASVKRWDAAWVRTVVNAASSDKQASSPSSLLNFDHRQSTNEVWLRQQHQRSGVIDCLPPNCDYLSALVLVAGRFISARFKALSPFEYANLRSVAANLLIRILHRELDVDVASQMVNLIAMPVLLTLQVALRENDATTQVKLLELLGAMFTGTDGHLLPAQHLHGDSLGLARQLFVRTLLAGLEHEHPLHSPASDSWMEFACSCVSFQQSHVRLEGFLIPILVSLCKRLAKRFPCSYSEDASHELLSLIRAITLVFRMSISREEVREGPRRQLMNLLEPHSQGEGSFHYASRDMETSRKSLSVPSGQSDASAAGISSVFGKWTMFGGADSGPVQPGSSDEAIGRLIKLLVPPGWIPAADGTTSVLGALLMCWGTGGTVGSTSLPGGNNQKAVRASVLQVIYWLFDAFPLQTLAALLQVWDADMSTFKGATKTWRFDASDIPNSCKCIAEVMSEVARQYPEEERVLHKCMELMVQTVRRKRNDISFKFKFTEASIRQFFLAHVHGRSFVDPSLRLLHVVTDTIKEAVASLDDPVAILGLFQLFDAYAKRLPALSDRRNRRALQECLHFMANACLALADLSLSPKAKSTFTIMGRDAAGGDASSGDGLDLSLAMARSKVGMDALDALADHLASLLEKAWKDGEERVELLLLTGELGSQRDRFAPLIAQVVQHLKPIIRARTSSMTAHAGAATKVLASLNHPMFVKLWRKDVLELFQDPDFFQMGSSAEHHWLNLVDVVMAQEAGAFSDLLGTSPLHAVFKLNMMGQETSKYRQHADYIKRLAFVVLAGDVDQYLPGMHEILEKLVEALRLPSAPGIARVYKHSFLCMRVLLLRISSTSLVSFWPIVFSEVQRVLRIAANKHLDLDLDLDISYAALRLLDMLMTLQPEEFLLMQWAFVLPRRMEQGDDERWSYLFSPATEPLAQDMNSTKSHAEIVEYFSVDCKVNDEDLRRPLLQKLEVVDKEELSMAAMLLSRANQSHVEATSRADLNFISERLRKEFDEFNNVSLQEPQVQMREGSGIRSSSTVHSLDLERPGGGEVLQMHERDAGSIALIGAEEGRFIHQQMRSVVEETETSFERDDQDDPSERGDHDDFGEFEGFKTNKMDDPGDTGDTGEAIRRFFVRFEPAKNGFDGDNVGEEGTIRRAYQGKGNRLDT